MPNKSLLVVKYNYFTTFLFKRKTVLNYREIKEIGDFLERMETKARWG